LTGKVALILKSVAHVKCENAIKKVGALSRTGATPRSLGEKRATQKSVGILSVFIALSF